MMKGIITEVQGPVVDVLFPEGRLPFIKDALTVDNGGTTCVMEVAQHMGGNVVRCIMLSPSEGLCRDMEVTAELVSHAVVDTERTAAERDACEA